MNIWRSYKQERNCLVQFARLANTLLKDGESARDNHVLACYFPITRAGRASAREVDDVISKSVRVAIDSTRRIIRVCTEVTAMRALATSSVATRETIWPSVVTGATLCHHG